MNSTAEQWQSLKDDRLVSIREIQAITGHDPCTIRRWIAQKKLIGCRIGGQLRCRQSQVLKFIKGLESGNG